MLINPFGLKMIYSVFILRDYCFVSNDVADEETRRQDVETPEGVGCSSSKTAPVIGMCRNDCA